MTALSQVLLERTSGAGVLDDIQDALDRAWRQHREVPPEVRIGMATAAGEIAANIIEHAGGGRPVWIRVEMQVRPDQVTVMFTDDGEPAAVDLGAAAMPDDLAERGRGLALARKLLGALTYRRSETGNHWTLVSRQFG